MTFAGSPAGVSELLIGLHVADRVMRPDGHILFRQPRIQRAGDGVPQCRKTPTLKG